MTPHIEAKKGDYHKTVLMPGDPLRAAWIANQYFDDAVQVNGVRNCLGFSGTYKGKKVSVQASGMGHSSIGIYAHELYDYYDVDTIIRVGSCGGISDNVSKGDIVVAMSCATDSAMTDNLISGFKFSPCCDYQLLKNYMNINPKAFVGQMISNDYFYQPNANWYYNVGKMGVLAVDMETHVLYSLAMRFNKKSLSVNTVSDHLATGGHMTSEEREKGLGEMIETVLDSI